MRLAGAVIGILTEDDRLHRIERSGVEGGKDFAASRIERRTRRLALAQEGGQLLHVRAREPVADAGFPARL